MKVKDAFFDICPSDVENDRYRCLYVLRTKDGYPVMVMQSKLQNPARWMVLNGRSTVYFRSRMEAVDHCIARGYR